MSLDEAYPGPRASQASCAEPELPTAHGLEQRLIGMDMPEVRLPFAPDAPVSLAELARRRSLVVFFYPGIAPEPVGEEQDEEADVEADRMWGWREHDPELELLRYTVVGVSTQSPEAQAKLAAYELLGYMLLSDTELELAQELALPTMSVAGEELYEPLTLVVEDGRIARAFYPVLDPAGDATSVTNWIKGCPADASS